MGKRIRFSVGFKIEVGGFKNHPTDESEFTTRLTERETLEKQGLIDSSQVVERRLSEMAEDRYGKQEGLFSNIVRDVLLAVSFIATILIWLLN